MVGKEPWTTSKRAAAPRYRAWAEAWQKKVQDGLRELETVEIAEGCFIAPEARLFAEPGRAIRLVDPGVSIAAHAFVHGPVVLEAGVTDTYRKDRSPVGGSGRQQNER